VLALVLGATVAGPGVISLRDLVERLRSAAVEAGITLDESATMRRSLVTVLEWMIDLGLAEELYERVEAYAGDAGADAVLKLRPDRIALLPLPALASAKEAGDLMVRARAHTATRQWMRCRLVEEPVLYRADLTNEEWSELRRRIGEEERFLEEMFSLTLEVRAEGIAAIDLDGGLIGTRFPTGGTVGHAALLLIEKLHASDERSLDPEQITDTLRELAELHYRRWSAEYIASPDRLGRQATDLLLTLRLAEWVQAEGGAQAHESEDGRRMLRLLPAAGRFLPPASSNPAAPVQETLL
jgi:uncharacterized protein (TIGR02678 family)